MGNKIEIITISPDDLQRLISSEIGNALSKKEEKEPRVQNENILNRKEAKEFLSISYPTLKKYVNLGLIASYRLGTRVFFKYSDLEDSLKKIRV